jgi:D-lactate dehydrogenase
MRVAVATDSPPYPDHPMWRSRPVPSAPKVRFMDVVVFSSKTYDREFLGAAAGPHALRFLDPRLTAETAILARGAGAVCAFVNDQVDAAVLGEFAQLGIGLVALRSAGFNNVDLAAARRLGIAVAHVPAYSPDAVAEHTVAMILALNRNIHRAWVRVREGNFALDGLLGFNMRGRVVGVVGTGQIGAAVCRIMLGFGCTIVAHDPAPDAALAGLGVRYRPLPEVLGLADILTLHCPLTPATRHLIDAAAIARMRRGAMLVNTSRGAIIDTAAVIGGLKDGTIGHLGLDVYEEEAGLFFEDRSGRMIRDDVFARLLTFPNVLVTGHQGFFTTEALTAIAATTIGNISAFAATGRPLHAVPGSQGPGSEKSGSDCR